MAAITGLRKEGPGIKKRTRPSRDIPHARKIGSLRGSASQKQMTVTGGIGDKAPGPSFGGGHRPLWHGPAMDSHITLLGNFLISPSLNKRLRHLRTGSSAGRSYVRSASGCTSMLVWSYLLCICFTCLRATRTFAWYIMGPPPVLMSACLRHILGCP